MSATSFSFAVFAVRSAAAASFAVAWTSMTFIARAVLIVLVSLAIVPRLIVNVVLEAAMQVVQPHLEEHRLVVLVGLDFAVAELVAVVVVVRISVSKFFVAHPLWLEVPLDVREISRAISALCWEPDPALIVQDATHVECGLTIRLQRDCLVLVVQLRHVVRRIMTSLERLRWTLTTPT